MPSITISGDGSERKVALEKPETVLGRWYKADVKLKDAKASREHCRIVRGSDGWRLVDAGSSNGTFVNGHAVRERVLQAGDRIQIGMTTITYLDEAPASWSSVTPPPQRAVGGTSTAVAVRTDAPPRIDLPPPERKPVTPPPRERASAKFLRETSRKRVNPLAVVIGLCALVLGGVTVWELVRTPPVDRDWLLSQMEHLRAEGLTDEEAFRFDEAAAKYGQVKELAVQHPDLKTRAAEAESWIRVARDDKARYDDLSKRFRELEAQVGAPKDQRKPVPDLLTLVNGVDHDCGAWKTPWRGKLKEFREALVGDLPKTPEERFYQQRRELTEKHKLESLDHGRFGDAIRAWRESAAALGDELKPRLEQEVRRLNDMAVQALARAKRKAEVLAEAQSRGFAAAHLEQQQARLAGTEAEAGLKAELKRYQ